MQNNKKDNLLYYKFTLFKIFQLDNIYIKNK